MSDPRENIENLRTFFLTADDVEKFDFLCDLYESTEFNDMLLEMLKANVMSSETLDKEVNAVLRFALQALSERLNREVTT